AVAHLELLSRVPEAVEGVRVKVVGSALAEHAPAAAPPGTTVTVRHLFFNTPPRRAFLKSLTSEANQVEEVLTGLALSRPQIRVVFTWDQRGVFDALPHNTLLERVQAVLGKDWAQGLIPLLDADSTQAEEGIGLSGFISSPDRHRNTRTAQYLFVNGRLVKNQPVSFALSRGYGELLPVGRFPFSILFLTLPPQVVDVNVHPTKREVKFQDERAVLQALVQRVRRTLDQANLFKAVSLPAAGGEGDDGPGIDPADHSMRRNADPTDPEPVLRLVSRSPAAAAQPALWRRPDAAEFRVLGQSHELFVLVEVEGELWIIDQHAAHERVIYEQVLATLHSQKGESQRLLLPLTFELPTPAHAALEEVQEYLVTLGFDIQPFGGNTYQVQATPPYFRPTDTPDLIVELAQARTDSRMDNPVEAKLEDLAARIACKVKSVKAGQTLAPDAMRALVISLLACQSPFVCP
ncbi:MAG: DNA mismatch repair endonuclease MutL, partial [Candidatus Binatia bacterium]